MTSIVSEKEERQPFFNWLSESDSDRVYRLRQAGPWDSCPCGSGMTFNACHMWAIKKLPLPKIMK